jgi:predicted CoA-binding protein
VATAILSDAVTALGIIARGRLTGVGHYVVEPGGLSAELALAVAHDAQHLGVGTLLTEGLVARARTAGIRVFTAEVASDNVDVLQVLGGLGLPVTRTMNGPETTVELVLGEPPVDPPDFAAAHLRRAERAEARGLRAVLAPRSVAVVGASRRPGSVGRAVHARILDAGFAGEVVAVNPHGPPEPGLPWVPSVSALTRPVDLAVVCMPAENVADVAEDCGRAGVRALLVLTSERARSLGLGRRPGPRPARNPLGPHPRPDHLRQPPYLAGARTVVQTSEGRSDTGDGRCTRSRNQSQAREPVVTGHTIYGLPRWHAYVRGLGTKPAIVRFEPGWRRRRRLIPVPSVRRPVETARVAPVTLTAVPDSVEDVA